MLRRYTFWLIAAVLFMLLSGVMHLITLFLALSPETADEQTLVTLLTTLRLDLGAGFRPTFFEIHTALSASFSLLCFLGGALTGFLLVKDVDLPVMKGVISINLAVFGVLFLLMAWFTYLPPILMTGLIFFNLLAAYILIPNIESVVDDI